MERGSMARKRPSRCDVLAVGDDSTPRLLPCSDSHHAKVLFAFYPAPLRAAAMWRAAAGHTASSCALPPLSGPKWVFSIIAALWSVHCCARGGNKAPCVFLIVLTIFVLHVPAQSLCAYCLRLPLRDVTNRPHLLRRAFVHQVGQHSRLWCVRHTHTSQALHQVRPSREELGDDGQWVRLREGGQQLWRSEVATREERRDGSPLCSA